MTVYQTLQPSYWRKWHLEYDWCQCNDKHFLYTQCIYFVLEPSYPSEKKSLVYATKRKIQESCLKTTYTTSSNNKNTIKKDYIRKISTTNDFRTRVCASASGIIRAYIQGCQKLIKGSGHVLFSLFFFSIPFSMGIESWRPGHTKYHFLSD